MKPGDIVYRTKRGPESEHFTIEVIGNPPENIFLKGNSYSFWAFAKHYRLHPPTTRKG